MSDARFKVTYSPEGVEPKVWEVDLLDGIKASEMIALRNVAGVGSVQALMVGVVELDMLAMKGLLWLLLKRNMSTCPWDGLDFTMSELAIDYVDDMTDEKLRSRLEALASTGDLSELGLARLEQLRADGVETEVDDPKA